MRRRALIGALLLIVVGIALGATVFRTDIAQATGLAQSVTIDNTAANPVPVTAASTLPVREQGLTRLLFDDTVRVGESVTVDVAGSREIRVYVATSVTQCPDAIGFSAVEEGSLHSFPVDRIEPTCGQTDTRLLLLPGRTLRITLGGFFDRFAFIRLYGRFN